jgi:hypothetical protein
MARLAANQKLRARYAPAARKLVVGIGDHWPPKTVRLYPELMETGGCTMFNSQ